ncbi:alpha/beta hydrolase [Chthonobacter albigriseus]|uniref:alpha/beta hydrolase n=1 Tax=Chthonobacter albigriseus TaxID=1683161 RepID=UPI0015EE9266|nr:alpha/beta hydrolase [Chthonobacter albigriseus]
MHFSRLAPFAALLSALLVAGCSGGRPDGGSLIPIVEEAPGTAEHEILVATTRERTPESPEMFTGERVTGIDFARVKVSIPPIHKAGDVEWPRAAPGDPTRDFVTRERDYIDGEAKFRQRLKAAVATKAPADRTVLVFVHGYNTAFDEGVYRVAQIAHDTGFTGVPVLFTWASRGSLFDYVYDRDSATVARDALEMTLRIASESGANKIVLFAHSMGNWVAVEALRQAKLTGNPDFKGKLTEVVLASPDIDVDVFKAQMERYGKPKEPFFMLISADDRALQLSQFLAGDKPRLGGYTEDAGEIASLGVVVVDLSNVTANDGLNHAKFNAVAPDFLQRLRDRLAAGDELDFDQTTVSEKIGTLGRSLGSAVGTTAGVIITTPALVITTPVEAIIRR